MLRQFLQESSIPGLRYLSEARGLFPRILWVTCILSSACAASVVIYYNVAGWEDSPTVVASVRPTLLEVNVAWHPGLAV